MCIIRQKILASQMIGMAKSRTFLKRAYTPFTFDLHDFLKVTAHPSSQNNLLVSYETDWTKGGNILPSQIFHKYVCWGIYIRPSNFGQWKYVLVTKTTNLRSFSWHYASIIRRTSFKRIVVQDHPHNKL